MLFRCCITRDPRLHSNQEMDCPHLLSHFPLCVPMQMNSFFPLPLLPTLPLYADLSSLHPASPSSSCSESGLQFVPLPHTSLFKMTLLHFMVNQLFCLTQSAGSASQPARINWGAGWGGGGDGGGRIRRKRERERERMRQMEKENKRRKGKKKRTNSTSR